MGVFFSIEVLVASLVVFLCQSVILYKLKTASAFLLFAGSLIQLIAICGNTFIEPSIETVKVGVEIHFEEKGLGPFLGSMAAPGFLLWAVGLVWFVVDVWAGRIANKSLNADASDAGAG